MTTKVIIGLERASRPISVQLGNCKQVTVIKSISSYRQSLLLMVIFKGKVHMLTWYIDTLPIDQTIRVSKNRWTDDSLGLTQLTDVFKKHTKDCIKGVYRLLILNGHRSHYTLEFDLFCLEHSIITLYMPLYSLHLLQPLDVSCFVVLKRFYRRQIKEYMQARVNHINKLDFLTAYLLAYKESMTLNVIYSGFAAIGLVPYNLERVLLKLNTQLQTPTLPLLLPTLQDHQVPKTPYNTS